MDDKEFIEYLLQQVISMSQYSDISDWSIIENEAKIRNIDLDRFVEL